MQTRTKRLIIVITVLVLVLWIGFAYGESYTIFKGRPSVKISEGGTSRLPEQLTTDEAINLECIISKIGDKYYWASRENTELLRVEGSAFITFIARNGSGYIRFVKPEFKNATSLMSETEKTYDYVEHLILGLRSVTYYGVAQR